MRKAVAHVLAAGVSAGLLLWLLLLPPAGSPPRYLAATAPANIDQTVLLVTFGLKDTQPRTWDGSVSVTPGVVRSVTGWRFETDDKVLSESSWKAATHVAAGATNILPNGVFIRLDAASGALVAINFTAQGQFSLALGDVDYGSSKTFLNGNASITRVPANAALGLDTYHNDYPAVAAMRDGTLWFAWAAYSNLSDQVMLRSWQNGQWADVQTPSFAKGDLFGTALAQDAAGRLWLVWSANQQGNWDLYASSYNGAWSPAQQLTSAAGPDIYHQLTADAAGNLWLVWQGFRDGAWKILLKKFDGAAWSDETAVSETGDNWFPAIATAPNGTAYVAWDSYAAGNFDVLLRSCSGGALGSIVPVAATPNFEANATVAVDKAGRVWVAWDESEAFWGKDAGFWMANKNSQALYQSRTLRVACLEGGAWKTPQADLYSTVASNQRSFWHNPRLAADSQGNLWLLFRRRFSKTIEASGSGKTVWHLYATWFDGSSWKPPTEFQDGGGRNDLPVATAADSNGNVLAAWNSDQRPWSNLVPATNQVFFARFRAPAAAGAAQLQAFVPTSVANLPPFHANEAADAARLRAYRTTINGAPYQIVRGDMHRHTDISSDGGGDGSLTDSYRYAIDAASLDYLAVTDHGAGGNQEYPWWRIQKSADLFALPGRFLPLFAYERSIGYPNGHRNVVFPQRGVRTLPAAQNEASDPHGALPLYQYLTANGGICMSHTSATDMGTDWRDNDVKLEPLVEIYQGDRVNAEYEGAPRAASPTNTAQQPGGYRPEGFVWNAWARGDRLGVQSSSDHISTHISYACLYVTDQSRAAMLEAIRKRRAYAATDNMILDVRMTDVAGEHFMGEEFTAAAPPRMSIKAIGSQPIKKLEIIRNNAFIYTSAPEQASVEVQFSDSDLRPGDQYYYVRVQQDDGQLAWSSPIWLHYRPAGAASPMLNLGGVVNAASFRPGSVAPGSLVSLFGVNLANTTAQAANFPLPTRLAGVSVSFDGVAAPLLYVSPMQINAQAPVELAGRMASVTVISGVLAGVAVPVPITSAAPGIFANGVVHADGKPISSAAPAHANETLLVYGTGIGAVLPTVSSGIAAPFSPLAKAVANPTVNIGSQTATVAYAGLAPGYVGLFQINAVVPAKPPTGDAVALSVTIGDITSNEILLSIR